jgi:hypothetical protein
LSLIDHLDGILVGMRRTTQARQWLVCAAAVVFAVSVVTARAQQSRAPQTPAVPGKPPGASQVEKLGPTSFRIGNVLIDTEKREVSVRGVSLEVTALEFIAVPKNGFKAYESALELDTNAINFNLGLILIGLDDSRTVRNPGIAPPKGDPVEIWVEWEDGGRPRKIRAEELIYNTETKETMSVGPWVYTGSAFDVANNTFLADLEGSLIGFVHTLGPVIDSPRPLKSVNYGAVRMNPNLNLKPGTRVLLTVRALPRP